MTQHLPAHRPVASDDLMALAVAVARRHLGERRQLPGGDEDIMVLARWIVDGHRGQTLVARR
jgi:hypothetical protein